MTIKDWIFVLAISGLGMMTANFIGFDVAFTEPLPGVLVLLLIALCAAGLAHVIPLKLPTVAYCSILGLLCACPLSPVSQFVIESAGKINFTAPLTMVAVAVEVLFVGAVAAGLCGALALGVLRKRDL